MPRARAKARTKTPEQVILEDYREKHHKDEEEIVEVSVEEEGIVEVYVEDAENEPYQLIENAETVAFPECCGVVVLHTLEDFEDLDQPVANAAAQLIAKGLKALDKAVATAALNHQQPKALIALKSAGFEVVAKGQNGSGNGIVVLTLPLKATRHSFAAA